MAKRIVVEFICDECGVMVPIVAVNRIENGHQRLLSPFPDGWGHTESDKSYDICPRCLRKANDMCEQGKERAK